ncbi:Chitinase 1 [Hibiscus syriacus]|uniref:Chitinase 1 n=1 Tax=Hibiscus syriacus TaxID=106335 RepID=A0A6A2ZN16_HIBSY|nr:Chitinase 1 [Hibiscus syriacus]
MDNNAITFPGNAQSRFYLCRSCHNHVLPGYDIIEVSTSGDRVQIYCTSPVNVRIEPSIVPLFYGFQPCGRSWGLGQSTFSSHSYPMTSMTILCNGCSSYLGRRQFYHPVVGPLQPHPLMPIRRRTLLSFSLPLPHINPSSSCKLNLFREYIGAEFNNVKFTDVPINSNVEFHFILSFAIDYDTSGSPPTNGKFNVFWDSDNLGPSQISSIKSSHSNFKVALSLGGDSVGDGSAYFNPSSVDSWVSNAVSSLTDIIQQYLDGMDIDYEHFNADPDTFTECIGQLIKTLKKNGVISFASIAPFDDDDVQSHYKALWKSYGDLIDYVNFQFYAYDQGTTVSQFINYFNTQSSNYNGGNVLASFISDGSGGLTPENGCFTACNRLKSQNKLHGIFVWSAVDSKRNGFRYEKQSQALLAISH